MMPPIEAAEIALLGSIMVEPDALRKVAGQVGPEHFKHANHRVVFEEIMSLMRQGKPYDVVSVMTSMQVDTLNRIGGSAMLFNLVNMVPAALNVSHYASVLIKSHGFLKICEAAKALAKAPDDEAFQSSMRVALAGHQSTKGGEVVRMAESLSRYMATIDRRIQGREVGFQVAYPTLHRMTAGIHKGTLWTMGGRTSRGKTSAMLQMALTLAQRGFKTLFISAEMTDIELNDRMIAMISNVPLVTLRTAAVHGVMAQVNRAIEKLHSIPLVISFGGQMTMDRVMLQTDTYEPDVVVVDYLQRFVAPVGGSNSRSAFYSDVANGLKALAMDKKIGVITGSQLSRSIEFRDDQTPTLADLKESGGIEEASDLVVLLNIPHYGENGFRRGEFIVAKHRNGPLGTFPVIFREATTAFQEVDE